MTRNPPDIDGRGREPILAGPGAVPAPGGEREPRPEAGRISICLLDDERDIDETWPLALAVHEESRGGASEGSKGEAQVLAGGSGRA